MRKDLGTRLREDNTRDRLFHPCMRRLGYPSADQVGATQYDQQGHTEVGRFDGCYLLDGRPMVLVELKRQGLLTSEKEREKALGQVQQYALAADFAVPPPFVLVSDGGVFEMLARTSLDPGQPRYQPLPRVLGWDEVRRETPGKYAPQFVKLQDLIRLFREYVTKIETEVRPQVVRLAEAAAQGQTEVRAQGRAFQADDISEIGRLLEEKTEAVDEADGAARKRRAVEELTAAAALNYVNKVFFLKYCEDRHVPALVRILAELELDPVAGSMQAAYAAAFLAAEQAFPVVYRPNPYDRLSPRDTTIVDMLCELRTKDFSTLDHHMVGEIYQGLLRNEQYRQKVLGAFYTPEKTVAYMVSRLDLGRQTVTLEPACGSGHYVEALARAYLDVWRQAGYEEREAASAILGRQLVAFDIDDFAAQLAAMRLFFLLEEPLDVVPNIFVRDTLDMSTVAEQTHFLDADGRTIFDAVESVDPRAKLAHASDLDSVEFDHIIGNPPYGGRPTPTRLQAYQRLYRQPGMVYGQALGSNDTVGFFVANAIRRAREGGVICLLVSDSLLSISTHKELRRLILDTCRIKEIVLAPVDLFRPVAISRTCILTLEKATGDSPAAARSSSRMRLVDRLADEDEYWDPPSGRVEHRQQSDYERVPRNPFFIRVHDDVLALFGECSQRVGQVTEGGAGLQTGDNTRYVALLEGSDEARQQEVRAAERVRKGQAVPRRQYRIIGPDNVVDFTTIVPPEPGRGFPDGGPHFVPYERGSSRHQYIAPVDRYLDYGEQAVRDYHENRSAAVRNDEHYFKRGLVTNAHNRVLRATLVEHSVPAVNTNFFVPTGCSVEYLLGLLNSRLATYLCTKILNTSIGGLSAHLTPQDIRLIPFAVPDSRRMRAVEEAVGAIVKAKSADPRADCEFQQRVVDETINGIYGLSRGAVAAIDSYWTEVLSEQPVLSEQATRRESPGEDDSAQS